MHFESAIQEVTEPYDCHIKWSPVTSKHVHALTQSFSHNYC